jgi:hypothetical protein
MRHHHHPQVNRTWALASLLALSVACHGKMHEEDSGVHMGHGADGGSDGAATGGDSCTPLEDGTWTAGGSCFGMEMTVGLTMDAETCTFALADWSMDHGNQPTGGGVDGTTVTLAGGDFGGCAGEHTAGASMEGLCSDGCVWEFRHGD